MLHITFQRSCGVTKKYQFRYSYSSAEKYDSLVKSTQFFHHGFAVGQRTTKNGLLFYKLIKGVDFMVQVADLFFICFNNLCRGTSVVIPLKVPKPGQIRDQNKVRRTSITSTVFNNPPLKLFRGGKTSDDSFVTSRIRLLALRHLCTTGLTRLFTIRLFSMSLVCIPFENWENWQIVGCSMGIV